MVDDQETTFIADILRQMKTNHEVMVSEKLSDKQKPKPLKLRRIRKNIPDFLVRLTTGKQILDIVSHAYAFSMDHDELTSENEVDIVGSFFQNVSEWAEIIDEIEPSDRISAGYNLTQVINELETMSFFVFGGREVQLLEGGISDEPSNWPVAIIRVLRNDNNEIIHFTPDDMKPLE